MSRPVALLTWGSWYSDGWIEKHWPRIVERCEIRKTDATSGPEWLEQVAAHCTRETAQSQLTALAVEPMRSVHGESDTSYVNAILARLQEIFTVRQVAALKGRLQRMNPVEAGDEYMKAFGQLMALEQQAISLRKRAMGGLGA